MVESPQVLLLPAHARYDVVSEILRTPGRFKTFDANVVIVEGFDEELNDEDAEDGGDEGVDEEEMREGGDQRWSFLQVERIDIRNCLSSTRIPKIACSTHSDYANQSQHAQDGPSPCVQGYAQTNVERVIGHVRA